MISSASVMKLKTFFAVCLITVTGIIWAVADPISVADVKALAKAGLSDDVILSQLRNARVVFHLNTAQIIELKEAGVSLKVIDFMISVPATAEPPAIVAPPTGNPSTATTGLTVIATSAPPAPAPVQIQEVPLGTTAPAPIVEVLPHSPDPYFVWVSGGWVWRHTRLGFGYWEWVPGYWARPPYRDAVWIDGGWRHRGWGGGYWR